MCRPGSTGWPNEAESRRAGTPTWCCSIRPPSTTGRSAPVTTCLRVHLDWSRTPTASARCWSAVSRCVATASPPARCPAPCCGPAETHTRCRLMLPEPTPAAGEFDPAELQGGLLMEVENVHERLRELRSRNRVMVGSPFAETSSGIMESGVTVLGYDECQTVLTHPDTYSSSIYDKVMGPVMGRTILERGGADHRAGRALVSPSFRSALLDRWRCELVELVVHELIDSFAPRGRAELARDFTFAFPVQVIARIMGLPRQDYPRFQRLSIELLNVVYNWDCGIAASATLKAYFTEILAERRRNPQDDLITMLSQSEI